MKKLQKLVSNIVPEDYLRAAQLRALKIFADTVEKTYGPMGGFTAFSKQTGDNKTMAISRYTKDGATVLKNIEVDKPIESLVKDEIIDITTQVIKDVGDGTSSATILSYLIFDKLIKLYKESGYLKRSISNSFKLIIDELIEKINENKKPCTFNDIRNIALTSLNGNEEIANIIEKIYLDYGMDVFIDVQGSNTPETIVKGYDGLVYNSGYIDPCFINSEIEQACILYRPHIYIFESPIDTPEMLNYVNLIFQKEITEPLQALNNKKSSKNVVLPHPTLIICPYMSRDANGYLDSLANYFTQLPVKSRPHFCIVSNTSSDPTYLLDLMKMTGAKFIKKYINNEQYIIDKEKDLAPTENNIKTFAGTAEKAVIDNLTTKIINPKELRDSNGEVTEFFKNYINELKSTLEKYQELKEEIIKIGNLKRRIHILQGNLVDLYVGGIGNNDRAALTYNIEDAVLNCRSAAEYGVGFGANYEGLIALTEIKEKYNKTDNPVEYEIVKLLYDSYVELIGKIYYPYFENEEKVKSAIFETKENKLCPFNIITGKRDNTVISSIKTEISILDSIRRIITLLFNTNQFLVPDPRFNIYTMDDDTEIIIR